MKRLIFLFVFGIMSLASFGQIDTLYLSKYHGGISYHSTLECHKIHKIVDTLLVSELTSMHQLNRHPRCYKCVNKETFKFLKSEVIKNSINNNTEVLDYKYKNNMLYMGGKYQEKSARCHFIALGFAGAAGLTAAIPSMMSERDRKDTGTTGFYVAAGILGTCGFISEICAYTFQLKSGKSLKVAANHIQYNF